MNVMGIANVLIGIIFFLIFKYYEFIPDCIIVILSAPIIFILNKYKNYLWAAYAFYVISFIFFTSMNLKMGRESLFILFYFPMLVTMAQLFGRKEIFKHFVVLCGLCLLSVSVIAVGYYYHFMEISFNANTIKILNAFNIILSLFTTITFVLITVSETIKQENQIKNMLHEKEVLLAEVFHRVKNNMNIVTSLLNLKKNMSDSFEVQSALEDCRSRVYSMALVHHKIFNNHNFIGLKFKDYILDLVKDVVDSHGGINDNEISVNADDIELELSNAIPCGLILNELITNSFKYAKFPGKKLLIAINLKRRSDLITLELNDNGPGLSDEAFNKTNSLGIELVKSLSEQIDGTYGFFNQNGMHFKLEFKIKDKKLK